MNRDDEFLAPPVRILLLEDVRTDAELAQEALRRAQINFAARHVDTREGFARAILEFSPDVILSDYWLPSINGLEALRLARDLAPEIPVIIVTGSTNEEIAVECMKAGAADYVLKGHLRRLGPAVLGVLARRRTEADSPEARRRRSPDEAMHVAILEAALDAILVMDHEGKIAEFNPAAERMFGRSRADVLGKPLDETVIPPSLRERHRKGLARYLATGEGRLLGRRLELPGLRATGEEFPCELTVSRLPGSDPPRFLGFVRDITARKYAEDALRFLVEVTAAASEAEDPDSAIGRCLETIARMKGWQIGQAWAPDSSGETMVCLPGPYFAAMNVSDFRRASLTLRLPKGSGLPGRVWESGAPAWVVDPENDPSFPRRDSALQANLRAGFAFPILSAGRVLFVFEFLSPEIRNIDPQFLAVLGRLGSHLGVVFDRLQGREERRALLSQLAREQSNLEERVTERTQDLREAVQELDAFSYTVSHDLRAPLRAMHGFSEALLSQYGHCLEETGRGYAERILEAARRMNELVETLLMLSRLGRSRLELQPVDPGRLLEDLLHEMSPELLERKAKVEVEPPLPPVRAHAVTLGQVFRNLLGNAVKFVAPGTEPRVRVRAEVKDERVRFWVEDNGIGIPPDAKGRLFRLFERLPGSERFPGTGAGLAIVKKAAERMNGAVGAESEPDEGSRFWVELPSA